MYSLYLLVESLMLLLQRTGRRGHGAAVCQSPRRCVERVGLRCAEYGAPEVGECMPFSQMVTCRSPLYVYK